MENPMKIGRTVTSTNRPIRFAIGTPINVEKNPTSADPIPAMCPRGCKAKAF